MVNACKAHWTGPLVEGVLEEIGKRKGLSKKEIVKKFVREQDDEVTRKFWDILDEKVGVKTFGYLFVGVNCCRECGKFYLDEVYPEATTKMFLDSYIKTLSK